MTVRAWHIMGEKISVGPEDTAREVSHKITSSGLPAIPVVSGTMELLGMVTEFHILGLLQKGLDLEEATAGQLMIKAPLTAPALATPEELVQMLLVNNCCAVIPIVKDGKYVGVVSRHMLLDVYTSPHYARFAQKDRKGPFVCL